MKWLVRYLTCDNQKNCLPYKEREFDKERDARDFYNKRLVIVDV